MNLPGMTEDPSVMQRADREADRLLEQLKKEVKCEARESGPLRRELKITVPETVLRDYVDHNFNELRSDAVVPGFRKGRAPMALIQKRYSSDVRESMKTAIVGQSFMAVVENEEIEALGDPRFLIGDDGGEKLMEFQEALTKLKIPESGDFNYTCEVEVKPTFDLPPLEGIEVKRPDVKIVDEDVTQWIERQRKIRGRYEPRLEGAAEDDDLVVADVDLMVDGKSVKHEDNVQLGVRPTRLDGISVMDMAEALRGAKAGDEKTVDIEVPADYERTDLRGKKGQFKLKIHELKRLAPVELATFVTQTGAESEDQLRQFVREDLELERDRLVRRAEKEQVLDYLLNHITIDVPENLSARQTDRAVMRQVVDLHQRGVPVGEIEAKIDELRTSAREEVVRDLKLEFIMGKVAEELDVSVNDEEVNTEIARIAGLYNQRFDRVRDDMQSRGLMPQLAEQIRQDKCVAKLLETAKITEVKDA